MLLTVPTNAESISNSVDIVEPRGNQGNLKNSLIVKSGLAQAFVVLRVNARRVPGQLHDIIKHDAILFTDRSAAIIGFERLNQFFIERNATQKLCVRFDSIMTAVRD